MAKINKKQSLADRIADVLSTAPASLDPEDELADETRAKFNTEASEDYDSNDELLSQFRRQNIDLLEDIDERYAGKKGSRKSLASSDEFSSDGGEEQQTSTDDNDNSEEELDEDLGDDPDNEGSSQDSYDEGDQAHEIHDVPLQVKKGMCVRNQLSIWENLLEMRIQTQKCLVAANKMPRKDKFKEIKIELDRNSPIKYPETKKLLKNHGKAVEDPEDEEIPSDTEDEVSEEDLDTDERPKKRRKITELAADIGDHHQKYKDYRNSVIRKWHDKTSMSVIKSNTSPYSVINSIEHTLADKAKLVKRTQLKRTDYKYIGEEANEPIIEENSDTKPVDEHNSEIFDDDDFYHQLLRELIEVKSTDITDPVQLGRQWIQLQNMRSKMKRKIDTRATKGRKIRYAVHTKLVNFMAPMDNNLWTEESKTELYGSLFGKNK
ncbi:hypothetical protein JTB14_016173 [Gonioctena quinquepunctata]|nr:hypothetical protein JTB14_016173 [Gonioctena quinquepunctata]